MESEEDQKSSRPADGADTDAYYGEEDMDSNDLNLSFLDEEDEE